MQLQNLKIASVTLGLIAICAMGQSPINDTLVVNFPNSVRVGSQTLNAGEYTIRQLSSASNSRLLEFSTDKGTSIQASATSIPALDNNNRNDSSVLLVDRGGAPQLHRIWIKGKSYGYEFPIDKESSNNSTASNNGIRLTAIYSAPQTTTATLGNEARRESPVEAAAVPTPQQSNAQAPQAQAASPDVNAAQTPLAPEQNTAQAPVQTPEQNTAQTPAQSQAQTTRDQNPTLAAGANQSPSGLNTSDGAAQNTPEMPKTAMNWMSFVLSGFGLLSLGWVVRTYAQRL